MLYFWPMLGLLIKDYYLDFAAHVPTSKQAVREFVKYSSPMYGNANSIHRYGIRARKALNLCKKTLRITLQSKSDTNVVFTSGGSESNELAIRSVHERWRNSSQEKPVAIISAIEHASIRSNHFLNDNFNVMEIPVDSKGYVAMDTLEKQLEKTDSVAFVSIIFQSSEIGTTQNCSRIGSLVRKYKNNNRFPYFHCDASQGTMYNKLDIQKMGTDLLTLCGQKFGSVQGSGVLIDVNNIVTRHGTPALATNAAFTKAFVLAQENVTVLKSAICGIKSRFVDLLKEMNISFLINGDIASPSGIINITFNTCTKDSEQLVVAFDSQGLAVSSKSACMGSQVHDSYVLGALGSTRANSIRFTLHHDLTENDLKNIVSRIAKVVND